MNSKSLTAAYFAPMQKSGDIMKIHSKSYVAIALAGLLCWSILPITPADAYTYTERYIKNRLFVVNNHKIKSKMLLGLDAGTAIALAGNVLDIDPKGLPSAGFTKGSWEMSAGANVANGTLKALACNSAKRGAFLKTGAAMMDRYTLELPAGLNIEDVSVSIDYGGTLSNRQSQVKIELLGDKGMTKKLLNGPAANAQEPFKVPLVDLVKNPTESFTLGFLASVTSRGRNCLADFNNGFSIHFLGADGQPLGVSSIGGFQQASAVPIPQSLILFGSAIVGLIGFRKHSLARHSG
jgi:hypothetical protein